jgi:hypothetical protein
MKYLKDLFHSIAPFEKSSNTRVQNMIKTLHYAGKVYIIQPINIYTVKKD